MRASGNGSSGDRGGRYWDREELLSIIEACEDAIIGKDLDGVVTSWNVGAQRLFGYSAEEAIGKPLFLLVPSDQEEERRIKDCVGAGRPLPPYETVRRRRDGSPFDASLTVSPIRDAAGNVVGAATIVRDVSGRKRAEHALAKRGAEQAALSRFTDRLHRANSLEEVSAAALDAISKALCCDRASILLLDEAGEMRFVAWRGISADYRRACEGQSPWIGGANEPQPMLVGDIDAADMPEPFKRTAAAEGIRGLAFIPLIADGVLIGKFIGYYNACHAFLPIETDLALTIALQLGFGIRRLRAEKLRRASDEALRRERELLQTIIDRIPVMITIYEPDAKVLRLNRAFERTVGWSTEQCAGASLMEQCYPDAAYRAEVAAFMDSCSDGWKDIRMRTRDGREIDTTWANIRLSAGTRVGIGMDISERKHAERLQQQLIRELNHRVRNTLAAVQAIANQTVRRASSPQEFAAKFSGRLQALARTHTLLADNTWQGAELLSLIRDQLLLEVADGERIVCLGPEVRLEPQAALHMAMVLHELGTNARRHGALSVPDGRLLVRWQLHTGGKELVLQWSERNGPAVKMPQTSGFGTALIEQSLKAQGGDARLRYDADGISCEIRLPVMVGGAPGSADPAASRSSSGT